MEGCKMHGIREKKAVFYLFKKYYCKARVLKIIMYQYWLIIVMNLPILKKLILGDTGCGYM